MKVDGVEPDWTVFKPEWTVIRLKIDGPDESKDKSGQ